MDTPYVGAFAGLRSVTKMPYGPTVADEEGLGVVGVAVAGGAGVGDAVGAGSVGEQLASTAIVARAPRNSGRNEARPRGKSLIQTP
jgi:hypothetical protein